MIYSKNWANTLADIIIYFTLAVSAFLCMAPILNTLAVSFSDSAAATAGLVYFMPVRATLASERLGFYHCFRSICQESFPRRCNQLCSYRDDGISAVKVKQEFPRQEHIYVDHHIYHVVQRRPDTLVHYNQILRTD